MAEAKDIAVLGGGFAGSYCANLLGKAGKNVTLFDMGRGVGEAKMGTTQTNPSIDTYAVYSCAKFTFHMSVAWRNG